MAIALGISVSGCSLPGPMGPMCVLRWWQDPQCVGHDDHDADSEGFFCRLCNNDTDSLQIGSRPHFCEVPIDEPSPQDASRWKGDRRGAMVVSVFFIADIFRFFGWLSLVMVVIPVLY